MFVSSEKKKNTSSPQTRDGCKGLPVSSTTFRQLSYLQAIRGPNVSLSVLEVCVYVFTYVQICGFSPYMLKARVQCWISSSITSLYFLTKSLSLNLNYLTIPRSQNSRHTTPRPTFMWVWGLRSQVLVFVVDSTEIYSQLLSLISLETTSPLSRRATGTKSAGQITAGAILFDGCLPL